MDAFAITRLAVGAAFLAVGAASDVRTRRVRDPLWIALGSVGLVLLTMQIAASYWFVNDWLMLVSAAILFYAVFYGRPLIEEKGFHARPLRVLVLAIAAAAWLAGALLPMTLPVGGCCNTVVPILGLGSIPVMVLIYQGFYQVGLLRGGADTKALIALTLLVPLYPDFSPFPVLQSSPAVTNTMVELFPFSLVVFVDAAVLIIALPLAYLILNVARREFEWPVGFLGTKSPIDAIPRHAWVMERVGAHGERYAVLFPSRKADESGEIEKLRAAGATKVWVERKTPFVVLLFLGFLLSFFVGNLVLGFLTAILPVP